MKSEKIFENEKRKAKAEKMIKKLKVKSKIFNFENYKWKVKADVLWFRFPTLSSSIHINNGETICIPFTTARQYNYRQHWAVVPVRESSYVNLFQSKKNAPNIILAPTCTYIHLHRKVYLLSRTEKLYRGEFSQLLLHHLYVYSKMSIRSKVGTGSNW